MREELSRALGIGLVEWMIVLFLSSLIIMVLLNQVILTKKQEILTTDALSQAYDLNIAGELIKASVRQAGYTPCAAIGRLISYDHIHPGLTLEAVTLDSKHHDTFALNSMTSPLANVLEVIPPQQIRIQQRHIFSKEDTVMIADCFHAEAMLLSAVKSDKGDSLLTLKTRFVFSYTPPVYVGLWQTRRFFMKKNAEGSPIFYFQQKHAEVLSDWIEGIDVNQIVQAHIQFLHIQLHLPDATPWRMLVRLRNVA